MIFHEQRQKGGRSGFTLPELLVVMGVIVLLIVLLLPALAGALRTGAMAKSQNNMKQISAWMTMYASENRDTIVPSQFDYRDPANSSQTVNNYPVKVRSDVGLGANRFQGTWTDILWTANGLGTSIDVRDGSNNVNKYVFDSPDKEAYENAGVFDHNPLRAAAPNSRDFRIASATVGTGPKPFGTGAAEGGLPGYFAANDFFNSRPNAPLVQPTDPPNPAIGRWYGSGQIRVPERSMYLVDSMAGETIAPETAPYNDDPALPWPTIEVDFRYSGACLMLFLDGHSQPVTEWDNLADLQNNRHIKVQKLDRN